MNEVTYRVDHIPPRVDTLLDSKSYCANLGITVQYRDEVVDITVDDDKMVEGSTLSDFLLEHGSVVDEHDQVFGQSEMTCDGSPESCRCK